VSTIPRKRSVHECFLTSVVRTSSSFGNISQAVNAIGRRRLDWESTSTEASPQYKADRRQMAETSTTAERKATISPEPKTTTTTTTTTDRSKPQQAQRGISSDPMRVRLLEQIDGFRADYQVSDSFHLTQQQTHRPGFSNGLYFCQCSSTISPPRMTAAIC